MKLSIEIGDKVKLITYNYLYTTYEKKFIELGFKNTKENYYPDNYKELDYKVIGKSIDDDEVTVLYFIKSGDTELLTSKQGIEFVEETLQIKKSTLLQLAENNSFSEEIIKKEFPELFEKELEDNTWYTFLNGAIQFNIKNGEGYGICVYKTWFDNCEWLKYEHNGKFIKSTEKEVFEALKNEAVKRGFKNGNYKCLDLPEHTDLNVVDCYFLEYNKLWHGKIGWANCIFDNGQWATIIPKETYIKIPLSEIKNNPNDSELGELVRRISENY